ncbi:MAG TPA: hypothetical protein VGB53_09560 [Rubricoccaceae bacterium]|jgi:hypothetical protein
MSDRPPLRLIPSPRTAMLGASREAADAATVEAILDGLPPGGRVRIAGEAAWLTVGLEALGVVVVSDNSIAADVVAFPLTPLPDDASAPAQRAASALLAARASLDAGGRVVVEAVHPAALRPYEDGPLDLGGEPTYVRTLASWVRVLAAAGLVLRSVREPLDAHSGAPAGLVLVAEPER